MCTHTRVLVYRYPGYNLPVSQEDEGKVAVSSEFVSQFFPTFDTDNGIK